VFRCRAVQMCSGGWGVLFTMAQLSLFSVRSGLWLSIRLYFLSADKDTHPSLLHLLERPSQLEQHSYIWCVSKE
jgi:hypothetical protein